MVNSLQKRRIHTKTRRTPISANSGVFIRGQHYVPRHRRRGFEQGSATATDPLPHGGVPGSSLHVAVEDVVLGKGAARCRFTWNCVKREGNSAPGSFGLNLKTPPKRVPNLTDPTKPARKSVESAQCLEDFP